MRLDRGGQFFSFCPEFGSVKTRFLQQKYLRMQFHDHHAVQVNRAAGAGRSVEGAGIIVHPDPGVVLPEEQSAGMAVVIKVVVEEIADVHEILPQPGDVVIRLHEKGGMLGKAGLVHVAGPGIGREIGSAGTDHIGNPSRAAVGFGDIQPVQNAAALVGAQRRQRLRIVTVQLAEGHIGQPGIPVPQVLIVLGTAGNQIGMLQPPRRLPVHAEGVGKSVVAEAGELRVFHKLCISCHVPLRQSRWDLNC